MKNTLITLREEGGYTQDALADLAGITRLSVIRNEQMLYINPAMRYLTALSQVNRHGYSQADLLTTYQAQRDKAIALTERKFSKVLLRDCWVEAQLQSISHNLDVPYPQIPHHPFRYFRIRLTTALTDEHTSQVHFAVMCCFHPSALAKFEDGSGHTIPKQIRSILNNAGMRKVDIDRLSGLIKRYNLRGANRGD